MECVQITVAEDIGVGNRGGYYDGSGALRDMIQNHTMQLLALTAMEPPVSSPIPLYKLKREGETWKWFGNIPGAKSFSWEYDAASETAKIRADFGRGEISYPLKLRTFASEETLAEAIFC